MEDHSLCMDEQDKQDFIEPVYPACADVE